MAVIALGSVAFALRLAAALVTGAFHHPELYEYHTVAQSLAAGHGFVFVSHGGVPYYSLEAPLYPGLCALVYALTHGSVAALLVLQMLIGALTAVLVAAIGTRLFNRQAGLAGGFLVAAHPGLIVYASLKAHALTVDAFTFCVVLWQFLQLGRERSIRRSVWAGLALGVGLLERPTAAVFLPVVAAWLFLTAVRSQRLAAVKQIVILSACAFLVILPWTIRNTLIHRQLVFMRSTNWEVFWRGNNPSATGHSYLDPEHLVLETLPPDAVAQLHRLPDEMQQARWFRDRAFAFIRAHPGEFLMLTLKKWWYFWWFAPQTGTLYPRAWLYGYQAFYVMVLWLVAACVRAVVVGGTREQRQAVILTGLMLLALSLSQSLHYVEGRHRWAAEPFLLLLAGWPLPRIGHAVHARWRRRRADQGAGGGVRAVAGGEADGGEALSASQTSST